MRRASLGLVAVSVALSIAAPAAAETIDPITKAQQLEQAGAECHRALWPIRSGDPSLDLPLFADRGDKSLGSTSEPFGKGRDAGSANLAIAARKYHRTTARVERVALYGSGNIACLVEIEHDRAQPSGRDDPSETSVRVTSILHRIAVEGL